MNQDDAKKLEELYIKTNKKNITFEKSILFDENDMSLNEKIAENIKKNKQTILSDAEILKNHHDMITNKIKMIKDILTYQMFYYNPPEKVLSIDKLMKIVVDELAEFQGIVGGYSIEDFTWLTINTNTNLRFKLKDSQIGIYNTIKIEDCYDSNLTWFLKKFTQYIRKFIDPTSNIKFDYKLYEDESNSIGWVLFVCESKSSKLNHFDMDDMDDANDFICEIENEIK